MIIASGSGCDDPPVNSLRQLAAPCDLRVGTIVDPLTPLSAGEKPLWPALITKNFDKVVSEAFHWTRIRPDKDTYNFEIPDAHFKAAISNKMKEIEIHHLVWGSSVPTWLAGGGFTKDQLIKLLREHILTVVGRYKDEKIKIVWSVVNEIYSLEEFGQKNFWFRKIGPEVVAMAFRWAREADPNAILIWNDAYIEDRADPKRRAVSDSTYGKIKELRSAGVPIDGIGMQMHLRSPFYAPDVAVSKAAVLDNMRRFGALGLKVYITEFDVYLKDLKKSMSQGDRWKYQADLYGGMMEACLVSGVCGSFSIFGLSDAWSWYDTAHAEEPSAGRRTRVDYSEPLPFDINSDPKPAYYALLDVLSKHCKK